MNSLEIMLKRIPGVDYETTVKRMSDNAAFYAALLRLFFNDDPPKRLAEALNKEDYERAAYEAHSMKGTAANLGLTEISRLADGVHINLKSGNITMATAMMTQLQQECEIVNGITNQLNGGAADA